MREITRKCHAVYRVSILLLLDAFFHFSSIAFPGALSRLSSRPQALALSWAGSCLPSTRRAHLAWWARGHRRTCSLDEQPSRMTKTKMKKP
ncbi:hypothetical protein BJ166DRAFT_21335 [Pestalotiopsis sp. NC0098]|nr:hypothetical protein BJ166DRAFT_21335 [Pestalotiopsis sp. NC0098]